ncbi:hypothetical protein WR25_20568 [Diploscapter pachys]|uniref:SEC63 domain-containing protein n=1 Tax=Diploscapter pachys TaxID=2018661 RepID=A0A2A2JSV7_9BILA|nr:hypothetical protein WR25_20568 [Diploscapter pachys]
MRLIFQPSDDENELSCSVFGKLACVYYLQHQTIRFLLSELKDNSNIEELLRILTHVPEYSEIPVRHNEDLVNTDLQKLLRIRFSTSVMDSSHVKAHLLFQAHFTRLPLQTDYRTDLKSVLDQCMRILQAMRDICMIKKWFATAVNITVLQQMCYSARWYDDHPLLCLPHLSEDEAYKLGANMTVPELQDRWGVSPENIDREMVVRKNLKYLIDRSTLEEAAAKEVIQAVCDWPIVSVNGLKLLSSGGYPDSSSKFQSGKTYRLVMTLRMAGRRGKNVPAVLPKWTKDKQASWLVLVGVKDSNHLLPMTQISPFAGERRIRVDVTMPNVKGRTHVNVFLMSDCYLGIDQEYAIPIDLE